MPPDFAVATEDWPPAFIIVEDSKDDYLILSQLLNRAGVRESLLWFQTGQEALAYFEADAGLRSHSPRWLFLDLNLPGVKGHEIIRRVRSHARWNSVRVAVVSGSAVYSDMRVAAELGADFYFEKFPSVDTLRRLVRGDTLTALKDPRASLAPAAQETAA